MGPFCIFQVVNKKCREHVDICLCLGQCVKCGTVLVVENVEQKCDEHVDICLRLGKGVKRGTVLHFSGGKQKMDENVDICLCLGKGVKRGTVLHVSGGEQKMWWACRHLPSFRKGRKTWNRFACFKWWTKDGMKMSTFAFRTWNIPLVRFTCFKCSTKCDDNVDLCLCLGQSVKHGTVLQFSVGEQKMSWECWRLPLFRA